LPFRRFCNCQVMRIVGVAEDNKKPLIVEWLRGNTIQRCRT